MARVGQKWAVRMVSFLARFVPFFGLGVTVGVTDGVTFDARINPFNAKIGVEKRLFERVNTPLIPLKCSLERWCNACNYGVFRLFWPEKRA